LGPGSVHHGLGALTVEPVLLADPVRFRSVFRRGVAFRSLQHLENEVSQLCFTFLLQTKQFLLPPIRIFVNQSLALCLLPSFFFPPRLLLGRAFSFQPCQFLQHVVKILQPMAQVVICAAVQ
jgi:hypothetical protein